jgi:hypothetical protein
MSRIDQPPPASTPNPCPVLSGIAGGALAGLVIAGLTLKLNPHLLSGLLDRAAVMANMVLLFGLPGLLAGGIAAGVLRLLGKLLLRHRSLLARLSTGTLLAGPLLYVVLLPDLGLTGSLLSRLLFESRRPLQLLVVLMLVAAGAGLGYGLQAAAGGLARRARSSYRRMAVALWLLSAGLVATLNMLPGATSRHTEQGPLAEAAMITPLTRGPQPVVLLCIDGASLEVIQPMVQSGQLPAFGRLIREGVWGRLGTIRPTLSPIVWTTIATGKLPEQHGIRGFVTHHLPGMRRSIDLFPSHTGLTYQLFPALETLPGGLFQRHIATSNLWQARPLWSIIGDHLPVGVYHWLVTWPAQEVNGFLVASHVYAGLRGWQPGGRRSAHERLRADKQHPPNLFEGIEQPATEAPSAGAISRFARAGQVVDGSDHRQQTIINTLSDPTIAELPQLINRFQPVLTASAFYSVDACQHRFGRDHLHGGPWENAVRECYRVTDTRLAQLLQVLPDETNLIVISDHGYDFARNHHDDAPPGIFFALGPAFGSGTEVHGLTVLDIAPLCLELVGLPLPGDMPGAVTGSYRKVLSPALREREQAPGIATYERGTDAEHVPVTSPDREEIIEQLRSLGYLQSEPGS